MLMQSNKTHPQRPVHTRRTALGLFNKNLVYAQFTALPVVVYKLQLVEKKKRINRSLLVSIRAKNTENKKKHAYKKGTHKRSRLHVNHKSLD